MTTKASRGFALLSLGLLFLALGSNAGCSATVDDCWPDGCVAVAVPLDSSPDLWNKLTIGGFGEDLQVGYNGLLFAASFDWNSGDYFFDPDPTGAISGDPISCRAAVNENEVQGECFRAGCSCQFDFWSDGVTTSDGRDIYSLASSTCRDGLQLGPFLVPLDASSCGSVGP